MDLHKGTDEILTVQGVEREHERDLEVGAKYGVTWLKYWVNFETGAGSCLCTAPDKEAADACHREAHGNVADLMIEVTEEIVDAFMGGVGVTFDGRAVIVEGERTLGDEGSRTIMFTDMAGSTSLTQRLGDEAAMTLLRKHNRIIRDCLANHGGREVKHTGDGIMASFVSPSRAVECAIAIQRAFGDHNARELDVPIHVRIGFSAGEPVSEDQDLFGAAVQLAARVCNEAEPGHILVAPVVRDLCLGKKFAFVDSGERTLKGFDTPVRLYEVGWS